MNIISCDNCGVLLDASKLVFLTDILGIGGEVDDSKAEWDEDDGWLPAVACPVCGSKVSQP